ncbi:MAG: metal-dependent transcriptional regulator [Candidatus Bathyarchaeia archaeon]
MRTITSNAIEECLEMIYRLEENEGVAKTSKLVRVLGVAKGTVTNAVERLEKLSLITHNPYKGVRLTPKGRAIALRIIRRHRLSECLLTEILKMDWEVAHESACLLEHSVTDEIADKIEEVLLHPRTCPHGNPIPKSDGSLDIDASKPLVELTSRRRCVVTKIVDEDPNLLQHLKTLNIRPGTHIEILERHPVGGLIRIRLRGVEHQLSHEIASIIRVRDVDEQVLA